MSDERSGGPAPNPGSDEARKLGCNCPVIDNGRGKGWMGLPGVFVQRGDCPLHGFEDANKTEGR